VDSRFKRPFPGRGKERGVNVTGKGMPGGHNMQEGAPAQLLAELQAFLKG
jgi:hypothetical protein